MSVFEALRSLLRQRYEDRQSARQENEICLGSNDQFEINDGVPSTYVRLARKDPKRDSADTSQELIYCPRHTFSQ